MKFEDALKETKRKKPELAKIEVPTMREYTEKKGLSLEGEKEPASSESKDRIKLRYFLDAFKKDPTPERKQQLKEMREAFKKRHGK